ncbi:MAG: virulence RhuM family protein [Paludibacteraceae bacterium]|nr:virulence RhuM family protein [Paludibacteraceae bacterium]
MNTQDLTKDTKGEIVIYQSEEGRVSVDVLFQDETVWLPIEQMSILFGKSRSTINEHILNIYKEGELSEADTVRKIGISDFSTKPTNFYNLDVVISVGYRVHSVQGTRFRQWATQRIHEYIIKGYTLDDERLKGNGGRYFRELLQRIRDIRSSERNLYQQVTDIYATAVDYDPKAEITRQFFTTVQNKMHYAAHQHTAAEVVYDRVDNEKPMLGMTNFKGNYITKDDVTIAKNYLTEIELQRLNLLVSQFFDYAELQAMEQHPMTMQEWIDELDRVLSNNRRPLLEGSGSISHQQAQEKAEHEYTIYRQREMNQLESDYDRAIRQLSLFSGSTEQLSGETSIDEE